MRAERPQPARPRRRGGPLAAGGSRGPRLPGILPLAGGVLSDRYLDVAAPPPGSRIATAGERYYRGSYSADNLARVARLRDLARDNGFSTAGLALAWLRALPGVSAPIVSPSTEAQWQAVREAWEHNLDDGVLATVSDLFR
ncbi:aldo/keto reductase [Amycolatopsis rhabdoformis]|uniref:Aldo/keto reductase n=1 Tax=Amycolatopsis rhabdoformis TaxID=1448059 RepID=A0ABZ1IQY1_9PSEU|nr:aldo/keto reductase [Amycolatopsis rhabdoformis]WSE35408.1 aldo/keto reductase [Amycolatopsis rhabdoformis]